MLPSTSSTSSGLSVRPPSSLSAHRPPSSTSTRPHSRLSVRSQSRHARSKLIPLCQALVTQVTCLEEKKGMDEDADFNTAVDFVVKNLEATTLSKGAVSVDMGVMDRQMRGHALKARLNSYDELGEAIETCYEGLKTHMEGETDLDKDIKKSRLPDHLQFLIKMSAAPSRVTVQHASVYLHDRANPPSVPPPLTWASILAEEPFEGEHWEGLYGLPPGFVRSRETPEGNLKKGTEYNRDKESERLDWDSRWSTPSLSPLNSGDLELDDDDSFDADAPSDDSGEARGDGFPSSHLDRGRREYREAPHAYAHQREVEALKRKQYWRHDWKGDRAIKLGKNAFDIGDASTLGPTLSTILHTPTDTMRSLDIPLEVFLQAEYINEEDAVREVLMALQGRKNILLRWREDDESGEGIFTLIQPEPRLRHLSLASQASILSSLAQTATTIQRLRNFAAVVFGRAQSRHMHSAAGKNRSATTRTLEAFADAVAAEVRAVDRWCARREEVMCRAWGGGAGAGEERLVISLLHTENDVRHNFERTFEVLLDVVRDVYPTLISGIVPAMVTMRIKSAATVTASLLNRLFESVQEHLERREGVTSEALMRVFVSTAEPVWGMIGRWLRDGMGLGVGVGTGTGVGTAGGGSELDDEFFIESSGLGLGMMGMGLLDPEFWKEGYALREGSQFPDDDDEEAGHERRRKTTPMFLEHVAEPILGAGKAVGLLRALGVPSSSLSSVTEWRSFKELVGLSPPASQSQIVNEIPSSGETLFSVSIDTLSRLIYDWLLPQCNTAGALLAQVLTDECFLWSHIDIIEDLFLMRKGDAMSHFTDILFAKMDTSQSWGDFHFLNTAFRDVVESNTNAGGKPWVQTSLVRLSYRGSKDKDKTISRTVKAIDGLVAEYAVPFPLTYIFQPSNISVYGDIFVFLVQIRRAKNVLERILVRGAPRGEKLRGELKAFYAMRSRLSWFINTFLNFLTTYVIHTQVVDFHEAFRAAKSLDEMIQLHEEHLGKIQGRCLLKSNTSSLHRAILSILDISLQFTEFFVTFAGDTTTTHDVSRLSISTKRHRSRRQRRQRRNTIGFTQSLGDSLDSSDEDEVFDGTDAPEPSFSTTASVSYAEEGFQNRMDKMSSELDGLVRFLRRGVESLAGGTGEAAPAFGVLAFALEDWDN